MELLMGSVQNQTESGGSSSTESSSLTGGLRFGKKIYFEDGSGSGSSKNRVNNTGRKSYRKSIAKCQVEGCRVDLTNAKTYYTKHKVCNIHSKSSKVIVSGLYQRFCQQCSRFHLLSEFDLEKRSCRRRLACHNERRRKPQAATKFLASLYGSGNSSMMRSVSDDPTPWSIESSVMQRPGPWLINQGSSSFTITYPQAMNNNNSTDSSCALSLLSNSNHQQQLQAPVNLWRPSSGFDSAVADRVTMAQQPPLPVSNHQYMSQLSNYESPGLGLSQISEPVDYHISSGTTMSGFELSLHQQAMRQYMEPENTRAYDDSSPLHFNWSL